MTLYKVYIAAATAIVIAMISVVPPVPETGQAANIIQWIRFLPGVIGLIFTLIGGYMMYRVTIHNKTQESLASTVDIYKEQLGAQNVRHVQMMEDHNRAVAELVKAQQEAKELRAKTDITAVLESQQRLLAMKQEHDAQIATTLKTAIETGQEQYKNVMSTLAKTLDYLSTSAREGVSQGKQNHELLVTVVGSINRIADKLLMVEKTVDDIQRNGVDTQPEPPKKKR